MTRARQLADAGRRANYLDNVASDINTQLNAKAPLASPTFTGNFTSVGIDDNADATAITIDDSERVGIGTTTPGNVGTGTNNSTGATLNVKSASGLGELTAQGATGGALNLVDTAGGTNDKWIRLIADGGYLKFLTMTDNVPAHIFAFFT